jgi:putative copper resistance protein D
MDALLPWLRGLALAAVLSAFGCSLFAQIFGFNTRVLRRVCLWSALGLTFAWLLQASATMAGADTLGDFFAAVPIVSFDTQFGHVVLARLAFLAVAVLTQGWFGLGTTAVAAASQAFAGHAAATGGALGAALMASEVVHMLAAGAWLGGLAPLVIALFTAAPSVQTRLCRAFSPLGYVCVGALVGTGLFQAAILTNDFAALLTSAYGEMLLVKLGLFAMLLILAVANRWWLVPFLPGAGRWLRMSVALETCLGLAVVLAASQLGSLAPTRF